jgi:hypothetical protein
VRGNKTYATYPHPASVCGTVAKMTKFLTKKEYIMFMIFAVSLVAYASCFSSHCGTTYSDPHALPKEHYTCASYQQKLLADCDSALEEGLHKLLPKEMFHTDVVVDLIKKTTREWVTRLLEQRGKHGDIHATEHVAPLTVHLMQRAAEAVNINPKRISVDIKRLSNNQPYSTEREAEIYFYSKKRPAPRVHVTLDHNHLVLFEDDLAAGYVVERVLHALIGSPDIEVLLEEIEEFRKSVQQDPKCYRGDQSSVHELPAIVKQDWYDVEYPREKLGYLGRALRDIDHALYLYERCRQGTLPDLKTRYVPSLGDVEHILYLWKQDLEHKLADPGLAECDREKCAHYISMLDQCLLRPIGP